MAAKVRAPPGSTTEIEVDEGSTVGEVNLRRCSLLLDVVQAATGRSAVGAKAHFARLVKTRPPFERGVIGASELGEGGRSVECPSYSESVIFNEALHSP